MCVGHEAGARCDGVKGRKVKEGNEKRGKKIRYMSRAGDKEKTNHFLPSPED